ncbi:hypothetical protein [Marinomonas transparens]|uniref:Uncharacterized protein n=1 Tax=Marinomonas transparens TaxID=2795388 RepID=A0A934JZ10_9GAMM|nr:hypothetical protein [Marinomonas transparens]MBJ7539870.1 hypothetical protein [Marinomonas transparens]
MIDSPNDLFNDFPTVADAYFEAANSAHDVASWRPSHAVVMEAARRVGFQALRRRDTGAGKRAFGKHYNEVCRAWTRGERFKPVVIDKPKIERLSEQELLKRRVLWREKTGLLKDILEGRA